MIGLDHFDSADNLLFIDLVMEKGKVTDFHGLHVFGGLMVAHPIQSFASAAAGLLIFL